jgi:hypothetical protein
MQPIIIDDFIPEIYQDSILRLVTGIEFPWTFYPYSVSSYGKSTDYYTDESTREHVQFRHTFFEEDVDYSKFSEFINPLVIRYQVEMQQVETPFRQRIKTNLLMKQDAPHLQIPHTDGLFTIEDGVVVTPRKTLLYYVNDSDGDTILYNEYHTGETVGKLTIQQKVSPKKGRAIIFDSHQIHSGQVPANNDYRIVVNCIFG